MAYGSGRWPLRAGNIQTFVFEHRYLRRIARIQWKGFVNNQAARRKILGPRIRLLKQAVNQKMLRHVLDTPVDDMGKRMKTLTTYTLVGIVGLPDWGIRHG